MEPFFDPPIVAPHGLSEDPIESHILHAFLANPGADIEHIVEATSMPLELVRSSQTFKRMIIARARRNPEQAATDFQ